MQEPSYIEIVLLLPGQRSGTDELPEDLKTEPSLNAFKKKIKTINFCIDNT